VQIAEQQLLLIFVTDSSILTVSCLSLKKNPASTSIVIIFQKASKRKQGDCHKDVDDYKDHLSLALAVLLICFCHANVLHD